MGSYDGKVAIVTGGALGMGRATGHNHHFAVEIRHQRSHLR